MTGESTPIWQSETEDESLERLRQLPAAEQDMLLYRLESKPGLDDPELRTPLRQNQADRLSDITPPPTS